MHTIFCLDVVLMNKTMKCFFVAAVHSELTWHLVMLEQRAATSSELPVLLPNLPWFAIQASVTLSCNHQIVVVGSPTPCRRKTLAAGPRLACDFGQLSPSTPVDPALEPRRSSVAHSPRFPPHLTRSAQREWRRFGKHRGRRGPPWLSAGPGTPPDHREDLEFTDVFYYYTLYFINWVMSAYKTTLIFPVSSKIKSQRPNSFTLQTVTSCPMLQWVYINTYTTIELKAIV